MTNSEIAAARTPDMVAADRGMAAQVSQSRLLARSHSLVWSGLAAEIRDEARHGRVIYSGTRAECEAEVLRRGL